MSEEKDIDIETFMRPRSARIRGRLTDIFTSLLHLGWIETEAEVRECTVIRKNYVSTTQVMPRFGGYVVTFTYSVDGKTYGGSTFSPDEVQTGDKFAIRYNPRHPEQNNSFESETNWTTTYSKWFVIIALLLVFYLFVRKYLFGD
jgi:hypothetical protein